MSERRMKKVTIEAIVDFRVYKKVEMELPEEYANDPDKIPRDEVWRIEERLIESAAEDADMADGDVSDWFICK